MDAFPLIDVELLRDDTTALPVLADQIHRACVDWGFFLVVGHGVDAQLCRRLAALSQRFFAQDIAVKQAIRMALSGPAWRGYFRLGDELTSGQPDQKEGLYFGAELDDGDPSVMAGWPLHGKNLFPALEGFRETVLEYLSQLTHLGHRLMRGIALSLGLEAAYFHEHYTWDPLVLLRIFCYPSRALLGTLAQPSGEPSWGVGEHTDYGLLTILQQDAVGGLAVKGRSGWVDVPTIPGAFVCNLGDMLECMSGGIYRSTPHRVRNHPSQQRLSIPFFFDPHWEAVVRPLPSVPSNRRSTAPRWDRASVYDENGTYGDYILKKIGRVFPELARRTRPDS